MMAVASILSVNDLKRGRGRPKKEECCSNKKSNAMSGKTQKLYPCEWAQCGMWFSQSSNLNKHYLTHTNEKPFKCLWPDCNKSFKQSSNLNKHRFVHTGEKPFACDYPLCQKRFSQTSNLKKHKLVHSGEKPFKCQFSGCSKMFDQSSNLNKHFLTHIGQKPHQCSDCGERFSQNSNLAKHMRKHGHYSSGPSNDNHQSSPVQNTSKTNRRNSGYSQINSAESVMIMNLQRPKPLLSVALPNTAVSATGSTICCPNLNIHINNHHHHPNDNTSFSHSQQLASSNINGLNRLSSTAAVKLAAANALWATTNPQHPLSHPHTHPKLPFESIEHKFITAHNFLTSPFSSTVNVSSSSSPVINMNSTHNPQQSTAVTSTPPSTTTTPSSLNVNAHSIIAHQMATHQRSASLMFSNEGNHRGGSGGTNYNKFDSTIPSSIKRENSHTS